MAIGHDDIRLMLENIRSIKYKKNFLNEEYNEQSGNPQNITINKQNFPDIFNEIKQSLLQKIPNVKLDDNYIQLNKGNNTLTLTGSIQNLNNLEFTITTDITNDEGLYVSVEGLNLTQGAIQILQTLNGFSKVFITEWTVNKVSDTFQNIQSDN
jgi:hypothetical protein